MYYSLIGLLAFLVLIITNHDVLLKKQDVSATGVQKAYKRFLIAVLIYYFTDMIWGILYYHSLIRLVFVDTEVYFIAMALGVLFWTQYVNAYLDEKNTFGIFLDYYGKIFFAGVFVLILINIFSNIMFWFDDNGVYHTSPARYATLIIQILLMFLTSVRALYFAGKSSGQESKRHLIIGLSGMIMLALIAAQVFYPLLPLYAIGYMLSCCFLRTFVIENEREEYRSDLEKAVDREKKQMRELDKAWKLAYTDPLTGGKSKLAYAEKEEQIDKAIADGTIKEMAVAVFDVNDLKKINDTMGHDAGNAFIISAWQLICSTFRHSPVFRVGGDEFVAILEGSDYENRNTLREEFNKQILENAKNGDVIVALGIEDFDPERDNSYRRIFEKADVKMYEQKKELKAIHQ